MVAKIKEGLYDGKIEANSLVFIGKENDFSKNKSNQDLIVRPWTNMHASPLANSSQHCLASMLHPFPYPLAFCCMLLGVVARSLKLGKLLSPQLPTILSFRPSRTQHQGDLDPDPST